MTKTKKVLSIILISLLILSTILTLCKKVGLCASDSSSPIEFNGLPYFIGPGIGYYDSVDRSFVLNCVDDAIQRAGSIASGRTILGVPYNGHFAVMFLKTNPVNIDGSGNNFVLDYDLSCDYILNGGYSSSYTNASFTIQVFNVLETIDNTTLYISSNAHYPVYVSNPEYFVNFQGLQIFAESDSEIPVIPDGHLKGGVLSNYIDSEDLLEDSSDMPSFDFTPPTTQQGFWDKLFGFFSRSFKSFNSWLLTIGDLIGQVIDKLEEVYNKIEDFFGRVFETIFSWLESIFDKLGSSDDHLDQVEDNTSGLPSFMTSASSWMQNFWGNFKSNLGDFVENNLWGKLPDFMKAPFRIASWFYNHGLKNGEFDFLTLWEYLFDFDSEIAYDQWKNNKYGDFILDVRDFFSNFVTAITGVTASDRVFFTISLGDHFGVYIPDIVIDFAWYASIRDQYLPYFVAFLYVTVIWLFFKRLPDILKGVAGVESSFMDNLPEHAPTHNGLFTEGVSHNQP